MFIMHKINFFEPQVSLYRRFDEDHRASYFLHIITFTDNSALQAEGVKINSNSSSSIGVELFVGETFEQPALSCIYPISYTFELGSLPNSEEYTLMIDHTFNTSEAYNARPVKLKSIKTRPIEITSIGEVSVMAAWSEHFGKSKKSSLLDLLI